jgi:uncharacterized protein
MKNERKRVIFDTNTLISAMIAPSSVPSRALTKAMRECALLISEETLLELQDVVTRAKFDRYFKPGGVTREQFLALYAMHTFRVEITEEITECLDPKDNMFLSLAVSARADVLVSGDKKHLLSMNPFRGVRIVSAADFLKVSLSA